VAARELGGIGPSFMEKQFSRLSIDEGDFGHEEINAIADEASRNCVLLVGKVRAGNLKSAILGLAEAS